jgi:hypothetical protein
MKDECNVGFSGWLMYEGYQNRFAYYPSQLKKYVGHSVSAKEWTRAAEESVWQICVLCWTLTTWVPKTASFR